MSNIYNPNYVVNINQVLNGGWTSEDGTWGVSAVKSEPSLMTSNEQKYEGFCYELHNLCAKYGVYLGPSGFDIFQLWPIETGDEHFRYIENCLGED